MLVYKDLHWWTVLRIYQIFLVKLKIFLSKMQVNTKEILLNHPSKGLAQCALYHFHEKMDRYFLWAKKQQKARVEHFLLNGLCYSWRIRAEAEY